VRIRTPDSAAAVARLPVAGGTIMNPRAKSRFRLVYTSLWGDAAFRRFSQEAKLLWLYLTTGPHTTGLEGLFQLSEVGLAHKLGWTVEELRRRWA
jgi:hypothetical protein